MSSRPGWRTQIAWEAESATLMVRSLQLLADRDTGFEPSGLLTMRVPLPAVSYAAPAERARFFDDLLARLDGAPGISGVAVSRALPSSAGVLATNLQIEAQPVPPPGHVGMAVHPVSWPEYPTGTRPIGERLGIPLLGTRPLEIVGVVADVLYGGPTTDATPHVYVPEVMNPPQTVYLAVRTADRTDPMRAVDTVRRTLSEIDGQLAVTDIRLMEDRFESRSGSSSWRLVCSAPWLAGYPGRAVGGCAGSPTPRPPSWRRVDRRQ